MSQRNNNNKSRKNNYRGNQGKPRDKYEEVTRNSRKNADCVDDKQANDPSWYAKSQQLLKDAASLPFGRALGNEISFTQQDPAGSLTSLLNFYDTKHLDSSIGIPGIATIDLIPTYGLSSDINSALNMSIRNIYSYVRHANSGHSNYDSPDLGLYLMSMDNAYTLWGWMVRLYGVMMTFNGMNRYYPRAIVEAMRVNYNDLALHLNDLRTYINMCASKLSSLYVPTTMPIFTRHMWLYRNIYLDAPGGKAQTYMFNPEGVLCYDELSGPGQLTFRKLDYWAGSDGRLTFEGITRMFNQLLNFLLGSEDIGIMSGDILKAYGIGNCYAVAPIPENYSVLPVYSEEVNMQIHNLVSMDLLDTYDTRVFDITQNVETGALLARPTFASFSVGYDCDRILDMYTSDISPEHTMVATRLSLSAEQYGTGHLDHTLSDGSESRDDFVTFYRVTSCGSELVARVRTSNISRLNGELTISSGSLPTSENTLYNDGVCCCGGRDYYNVAQYIQKLSDMACFDWAPLVRVWNVNRDEEASEASITCVGYLNDLDNYTLISTKDLKNINDVALLSLLDVPASV